MKSKLTILGLHHKDKQYRAYYLCRCECGNEKLIRIDHLKDGGTLSCGCLNKKLVLSRFTKHNMWNKPIYRSWCNLKRRASCTRTHPNPTITICDEWKKSFVAFYEWSKDNGYEEGMVIVTTNDSNHYEPKNCKWEAKK